MLQYINVPNTNFSFSRIGFGAEQLGLHNWGNINELDLDSLVNSAIENGINFFDTADVYGLGKSEENLALFLGDKRKDIHIITKFGVRFKNSKRFIDNSSKWIIKAIEGSLKRLKTDYIDLYQLHYWDGKTDLDSITELLTKFKEEGKIRSFGISNIIKEKINSYSLLYKSSSSFSFEFSLAEKKFYEDIKYFNKKMIFLAYGGLGQGILTGKYNLDTVFLKNDRRSSKRYKNFHGNKLKKNLLTVEILKEIARLHNVSVSSVALRYIYDFLPNSCIICGMKNTKQLNSNLDLLKFSLSNEELDLLTKKSYE